MLWLVVGVVFMAFVIFTNPICELDTYDDIPEKCGYCGTQYNGYYENKCTQCGASRE